MDTKMEFDDLSHRVIGGAIEVRGQWGPGRLERSQIPSCSSRPSWYFDALVPNWEYRFGWLP